MDTSNNSASCSFSVTVIDNELPQIICPPSITANVTTNTCATNVSYTSPTGADNCPGQTTIQTTGLSSGSSFPTGTTTNIFRVTDASNNSASCSFAISIIDNQPPQIVCPLNITANVISNTCAANVNYTAPTGTDNCSGQTTIQTAGLASGSSFATGTTTNIFKVTDGSNNTASCSFTITVIDNELPQITCPANIIASVTTNTCAANVTYSTPTGTDNCSGQITTQIAGLGSGTSFATGTTTNNFRVTDASNNSASCSFTITIIDNELPQITCPANITANVTTNTCAANVTYTIPNGTDNCSGQTTTQMAGLGSAASFPTGTTTNIFRVTDATNNSASCSFSITIIDNELPQIICPSNIIANVTPNTCAANVTYTTPIGTDNCSGQTTIQTAGLSSGSSFPTGITTNIFRVTDASNNSASCSFTITIIDNQVPQIVCHANITANVISNTCAANVTYTAPTGTDNCSGQTTIQTTGLASGSSFARGTTTNIFQVTDASNNTASCSFTVSIIDNQPPQIACPANITANVTASTCATNVTYTAPAGTDNCSGQFTTQTAGLTSGAGFPTGTTTNIFRVTDASNNSASCSFTVTVIDNELPQIICPTSITANVTTNTCAANVTYTTPIGTDNCSGQTTTQTAGLSSAASFPTGITTNIFRVTDASNNSASCSFSITIIDNQPPQIICPANITANVTPNTCAANVTYTSPTGTDNCSGQTTIQTGRPCKRCKFPNRHNNKYFPGDGCI